MTDLNDPHEDSPGKLSRRTVGVGTAWAVPIVMGVGTAPAMAASLAWTINAPLAFINIANAGSFVVSGTGVTGQSVGLTVTGLSPTPTPVLVDALGNWTFTLNLSGSGVPQGTVTFLPTGHAFAPSNVTAVKDTIAPTLGFTTLGAVTTGPNNGLLGTMTGTKSPDVQSVAIVATGITLTGTTSYTSTGWSRTWTAPSKQTIWTVKVNASDTAGNPATEISVGDKKTA